ncbi:MAG TPA: hypothetical protein VK957_13115 [Lunatimonas sp.]|nr:hypothetical protein [Lunatimonas sp.]
MIESASVTVFILLTGIIIIFQGCLAAGMPWGEASMGGKYPGKYPPKMRVVAVINMLVLVFVAAIVLSHADLILPQLKSISRTGIWFVVGFLGLGTVLNTITPSKIERIWAPVALIQMIAVIIIAIS